MTRFRNALTSVSFALAGIACMALEGHAQRDPGLGFAVGAGLIFYAFWRTTDPTRIPKGRRP